MSGNTRNPALSQPLRCKRAASAGCSRSLSLAGCLRRDRRTRVTRPL